MFPCCGLILSGGRSSRMGQPKENLAHSQEGTLLTHSQKILAATCEGPIFISRPFNYSPLMPQDIVDRKAYPGPLEGIYLSLTRCRYPWLAVLAVDLPAVSAELFSELYPYTRDQPRAVLPITEDRRQPLAGFWSTHLTATLQELLTHDIHRVDAALTDNVSWIPISRPEWLTNLNTPQEYHQWREQS